MTSTQKGISGGRLPSSPSDGSMEPLQRVQSPNSKDKGKQREIDPSSEMDYNDMPDQQADPFDAAYDETKREDSVRQGFAIPASMKTLREEIISFLFDHIPRNTSQARLSLFSLVNPDFPPNTSEDRIHVHRDICQKLFHCFGHRPETVQPDKKQLTAFIWDVLEVLLDFVEFFSLEGTLRTEVVNAINLIQDLCQRYAGLALHTDTTAVQYETIVARIFNTIINCVKNEKAKLKSREALPTQSISNNAVRYRSAAQAPKSRQARNEVALAHFEKEVEELLCAILHLIQFLALRPDLTRLSQCVKPKAVISEHSLLTLHALNSLDAFLRESNNLAFLLDARRRTAVHLQALTFTALLSGGELTICSRAVGVLLTCLQNKPFSVLSSRPRFKTSRTATTPHLLRLPPPGHNHCPW